MSDLINVAAYVPLLIELKTRIYQALYNDFN